MTKLYESLDALLEDRTEPKEVRLEGLQYDDRVLIFDAHNIDSEGYVERPIFGFTATTDSLDLVLFGVHEIGIRIRNIAWLPYEVYAYVGSDEGTVIALHGRVMDDMHYFGP